MSVFKFVPLLGNTASFYDWFQSYNVTARDKMNSTLISRPYAGDGITFAGNTTDGGYTFAIDGEIDKNIIFNGNIQFNGLVNLSNVELSNILVGITGNFISSGVTAGSLVRITNTGGLTLAKANDAQSAESIGVAMSVDTTKTIVAVAGKIIGTTYSNYLSPGGFSLGCVYFLDPINAGGITKTEPVSLGYVSKPVLIGAGQHEAIILPYRGQYINDDGISGDATFNSAFFATIKSIGETLGNFKLVPGTIVAGAKTFDEVFGSDSYFSYLSNDYLFYKANSNDTPRDRILGIVTEIVEFNSTTNQRITLKVSTNGSAIPNATSLNPNWSGLANANIIYLGSTGNPTLEETSIKLGSMAESNFVFDLLTPSGPATNNGGGGGGGGSVELVDQQNILTNGSLLLWQRGRGVTTPYGITTGSSSPVKQYLADKWVMWAGVSSGFTAMRHDFTNTQIVVPGYPKHSVSLIKNSNPTNIPSYFYNVIDDVRTIADKVITFSFYVKTSGPTGQFRVKSIQNISTPSGNSYINETVHATFSADLNWTRKYVTMLGPSASSGITSSYSLIGVELSENGKTFNFAQFMLNDGYDATDLKIVDADAEYRRAAKYYQRTYLPDELTGTQYQPTPAGNLILKGANFSKTGRYPSDSSHFPVKMIKAPSMEFYSLSGTKNDVTIFANGTYKDMKQSSGDNVLDCIRFYVTGMPNPLQVIQSTTNSFTVSFSNPWCNFDYLFFHYVADADTTIN